MLSNSQKRHMPYWSLPTRPSPQLDRTSQPPYFLMPPQQSNRTPLVVMFLRYQWSDTNHPRWAICQNPPPPQTTHHHQQQPHQQVIDRTTTPSFFDGPKATTFPPMLLGTTTTPAPLLVPPHNMFKFSFLPPRSGWSCRCGAQWAHCFRRARRIKRRRRWWCPRLDPFPGTLAATHHVPRNTG